MFRQARRIIEGVDICDEKDLLEDIRTVGPGGDFLRCKSTRDAFRTDEIKKILAADPVSPVDYNTRKLVEEIIEAAKKSL